MSKELRHIEATLGGSIVAEYRYTAFGAVKVAKKSDGWPSAVTSAAASMLAACQSEADSADLGVVAKVECYTALSDPEGHPGFSAPGGVVDITFAAGNSPASIRVGDDEEVPAGIASARDALKTAVSAAL